MKLLTADEIVKAIEKPIVSTATPQPKPKAITKYVAPKGLVPSSTKKKRQARFSFCHFCGEKVNLFGMWRHEQDCGLNPSPKRKKAPCSRCRVPIDVRGMSHHLEVCKGDANETNMRLEKAEALRITNAKKRAAKNRKAIQTVSAPVVVEQTSIVLLMVNHLGNRIADNAQEFADWVQLTHRLLGE